MKVSVGYIYALVKLGWALFNIKFFVLFALKSQTCWGKWLQLCGLTRSHCFDMLIARSKLVCAMVLIPVSLYKLAHIEQVEHKFRWTGWYWVADMTIVEIVELNKELVAWELGLDRIGALELREELSRLREGGLDRVLVWIWWTLLPWS